MNKKFLLALLIPVTGFIMNCGPVDMQDDAKITSKDVSADIVEQNIDSIANLNLSEGTKSDYWLANYIPSAYSYYGSHPFSYASSYPYFCNLYFTPTFFGWRN